MAKPPSRNPSPITPDKPGPAPVPPAAAAPDAPAAGPARPGQGFRLALFLWVTSFGLLFAYEIVSNLVKILSR